VDRTVAETAAEVSNEPNGLVQGIGVNEVRLVRRETRAVRCDELTTTRLAGHNVTHEHSHSILGTVSSRRDR
jgi:hypothetical protein